MPQSSTDHPDRSRRRTPVDPTPVREQAQILLAARNRRGSYWDGYRSSGDTEELQRLVEKAVPFLEAGDGANALRILASIVEAFVDDWLNDSQGSDEQLYELFPDLGGLMAEAALMAELFSGVARVERVSQARYGSSTLIPSARPPALLGKAEPGMNRTREAEW
jgi:hypothetical protein